MSNLREKKIGNRFVTMATAEVNGEPIFFVFVGLLLAAYCYDVVSADNIFDDTCSRVERGRL